jgi:hypothetical protein
MLFMPDSDLTRPHVFLTLAIISFSAAVVWTCTGKAWAHFHGWVYRAEEPTDFWWTVAIYCLGALLFLGAYLYGGP